MARLILLDRDGVINVDSPGFIKSPAEWRPLPGALDAIAALKRAGFRVAVCSNQSGVARGLLSVATLAAIHARLHDALSKRGVALDALSYCPHHPDDHCGCRKPQPGMLLTVMQQLDIPPGESVLIGDSLRDIAAGRAAGCRTILVRTGNGRDCEAEARALGVDAVFDDLREAAKALGECSY
jgi:D-glycero-D-manno-heptose 1,7-bisphosphate phosphatase